MTRSERPNRPPHGMETRREPHPKPAEMALRVGSAMLIAASVALLAQWVAGPAGDSARSSYVQTRTSPTER